MSETDDRPETPDDARELEARSGPSLSMRSLGTSAALLTVASVLGQVLALVRELFIADRVGVSGELDALLVALVLPSLVAGTLAAGVVVAIVPARAAVEAQAGVRAARGFVGGIFAWVVVIATGATLVVVAVPELGIAVAGPGLDDAGRAAALRFSPLLAPITVFAVVSALLSTICQMEGRFRAIAAAWFLGPAVSLLTTVAFYDSLGLAAFAWGITGSFVVSSMLLLVYVVVARLLTVPTLRLNRLQLAAFGRHALPLSLSGIVNQFKTVADRAVASLLPSGAISALRYGETLVLSPTQAIAPAWTLVVYPALVRTTSPDSRNSLGESVQLAIRYIIALLMPVAVATSALAPLLVDLVYKRGAFDERAAIETAAVVATLGPMFVLTMIQGVLVPAHNARRRGSFLLLVGVAGAIGNLVLNLVLGLRFGVGGIGLSTSLTLLGLCAIMAWRLERNEPGFHLRPLAAVGLRAGLAALIPAIPIGLIAWRIGGTGVIVNDVILLVALSTVGAAAYVVLAGRLGVREPFDLILSVWSRGWRRAQG